MQNEEQAIAWLQRAARKEHMASMATLGQLLASDTQRAAEGVEWLRKAALGGDVAYEIRSQ